jgi:hypothetical protein
MKKEDDEKIFRKQVEYFINNRDDNCTRDESRRKCDFATRGVVAKNIPDRWKMETSEFLGKSFDNIDISKLPGTVPNTRKGMELIIKKCGKDGNPCKLIVTEEMVEEFMQRYDKHKESQKSKGKCVMLTEIDKEAR